MMDGEDLPGIDLERIASPVERTVAILVATALIVTFLVVSPWAAQPEREVPGFMALFGGSMDVIDIVLAVLLYSKGAIGERNSPIILAAAYLFSALMIVPHIAAFPGAIIPEGLLGTSASAVWLWSFWHAGFAVAIIRYALDRKPHPRPHAIAWSIVATTVMVVALSLLATVGEVMLPPVLIGKAYHVSVFSLGLQTTVVLLNVTAFLLVGWRLRLGFSEELWLTVAMLAACVDVGLTFQAGSRFSLGWYIGRAANLITSLVVLVSLFRDILQVYASVACANRKLRHLAHVDGLTGLSNRRHLDHTIAIEFERAWCARSVLSVVMVDVDYFKSYNDRYGHQAGDDCLRQISSALRDSVQRPDDLVARYGGEEFALVLPSTDLQAAIHIAEKLRRAIRLLALSHDGSPFEIVTVSVGVASTAPCADDGAGHILAEADAALYRAKQAGRDQVHYRNIDRYPPLELVGSDAMAGSKVA